MAPKPRPAADCEEFCLTPVVRVRERIQRAVVTNNRGEISRVPNLLVVAWTLRSGGLLAPTELTLVLWKTFPNFQRQI